MRTARRPAGRAVVAKVLAAAGALSLVTAFALAALLQPFTSLGQVLMKLDQSLLVSLDRAERTGTGLWLWTHAALPLLMRPAWMLPVMLGIIFVGAAAQLAWGSRR